MKHANKRMLRISAVLDAVLFALLLISGTHWFLALILTEAIAWLVRLIWISPMLLRFILRRLFHMIPIILGTIAIGFLLIQMAPGDVFTQLSLNPDIRPEQLELLRRNFGLDRPWYIQFFRYIWNALRGDFGFSQIFKAPVFTLVSQRAGNTLILALATLVFAWGFSIPAGILAATKQYSFKDQVISVFAFLGLSIPNYFLAFLLLYLVSTTGNWLPIGGMYSVNVDSLNAIQKFWDLVKHAVIPVVVLSTSITASLVRVMRANMLEILSMQYITTARAKGLKERTVVYKHALRNGINPMITLFGFQIGDILGGAALVESVCAWPGLGNLILKAILSQDLYLVIGSLIYGVILLVIGNLVGDIMLAVVDPRVRIS